MNTRVKFMAGGILILGTAGYLMASSIRDTGMFWLTPTELVQKVEADPSFRNVGVKVTAVVVPGSISRGETGRDIRFTATDGVASFPVSYNRTPPDTFADSSDVILTGKFDESGTFVATELLAKCASRFEVAPDSTNPRFRESPGYQGDYKAQYKGTP